MNERTVQLWVGVMVFATFLIGAILILLLGNKPAMFQDTYTVYADFTDAPGVTENTPVRRSGILIGRVKEIKLDRSGKVRVTLGINRDVELPANDQCNVAANNFLGDSEIEFALPRGAMPSKDSIQPETVLEGGHAINPVMAMANLEKNLSGAIDTVSQTSEGLTETIQKINGMLDKNTQHIDSIFAQTDETLKLLRETVEFSNDVMADDKFRQQFKEEFRQLPQTLHDARGAIVQLKTTMQNMDQTMGLVDDNLRNIKEFTEPLGKNGGDIVARIDEGVERLNRAMVDLEGFSKSINSNEGSLGKLVKDDELYERLMRTLRNVEEVSYKIKPIVNDVRIVSDKLARHPGSILRDAVKPGPGTKGLPPSNWRPEDCTRRQPSYSAEPTGWTQ